MRSGLPLASREQLLVPRVATATATPASASLPARPPLSPGRRRRFLALPLLNRTEPGGLTLGGGRLPPHTAHARTKRKEQSEAHTRPTQGRLGKAPRLPATPPPRRRSPWPPQRRVPTVAATDTVGTPALTAQRGRAARVDRGGMVPVPRHATAVIWPTPWACGRGAPGGCADAPPWA